MLTTWDRRILRVVFWFFPEVETESRVFENAFHRCSARCRGLEADLSAIKRPDEARIVRVDCAIARQLQASIERSGRMRLRLFKLSSGLIGTDRAALVDSLHQILRDEEPTWAQ